MQLSVIHKCSTQHPRPPIRGSPYSSSLSSSTGTITTIFVTGRLYCPHNVLIFTFLVFPSCPGNVSTIRPIIHFPLTAFSSTYVTTSLTFTSRRCVCHFFLRTNDGKTSLLHFLQNESTSF